MNKFYTITVGGEEYKARLTASAISQVEKKLGRSLFYVLEHIQDNMVESVTTIIWGALQPLNDGFTMDKAMKLFDDYIDEGHSIKELLDEVKNIFEASGFFRKGQV